MLKELRKQTKSFVWFAAGGFILSIFLVWGMDITGRRGNTNIVLGEVNGEEISYLEYKSAMDNSYQRYLGDKKDITEEDVKNFQETVWTQIIQQKLIDQMIDKYEIVVTDDEVGEYIYDNIIKPDTNFYTNGEFDVEKYRQIADDPNNQQLFDNWHLYYKDQLIRTKLFNRVTSHTAVTDAEIKEEYKNNWLKAGIEYLHFTHQNYKDDDVKYTDNDLKKYFEENKDDYIEKAKADVQIVKIPKVREKKEVRASHILFKVDSKATQQQKDEALKKAKDALARAQAGEDFNKLAQELSQDPSAKTNMGDLGYFDDSRMVKPFSDMTFSMNVGDISDPVLTVHGYHVIKLEDIKEPSTEEEQLAIAEKAEGEIKKATNLKELSDKIGLSYFEREGLRQSSFVPTVGKADDAAAHIFDENTELNVVSDRFETDKWFFWIKVLDRVEQRHKTFDEAKMNLERNYKKNIKEEMAEKDLEKYYKKIKSDKDFDNYFAKDSLYNEFKAYSAPQFGFGSTIDRTIGKNDELNKTIFEAKAGDIAKTTLDKKGAIIYKVLSVDTYSEEGFNARYDEVKAQLTERKRNEQLNQWYQDIYQTSSIIDNRAEIFKPREEETN